MYIIGMSFWIEKIRTNNIFCHNTKNQDEKYFDC